MEEKRIWSPEDCYVGVGYFRIPTPQGEGIVCVAVRKTGPTGHYWAAFSFCSPLDRHRFNKSRARDAATTRLCVAHRPSHRRWTVQCSEPSEGWPSMRAAMEHALEISTRTRTYTDAVPDTDVIMAPGWFVRAFTNGRWEQRRFGMRNHREEGRVVE